MKRKNTYTLIIGSLVGLILIVLWLRTISPSQIITHFRQVRLEWVGFAALVYLSAYFIRSWRWNLLIDIPQRPSLWQTWMYAMGGNWLNYMIPIRIGDVGRAWFIKRYHKVSLMSALPSVFIDKAFDTIAILFVIIILPFSALEITSPMLILLSMLIVVFVLTAGLLLLAAWYKELVISIFQKAFFWLPPNKRASINNAISLFINQLNIFEHQPRRLFFATLLTALGIGLDGLYFYLLFIAFKLVLPFPIVLLGYTLINLSYALPQPPAQLGSNEWLMLIVFSIGFGLTKSAASAIMAFAHILSALLMSGWGIAVFAHLGKDIILQLVKGDRIDD